MSWGFVTFGAARARMENTNLSAKIDRNGVFLQLILPINGGRCRIWCRGCGCGCVLLGVSWWWWFEDKEGVRVREPVYVVESAEDGDVRGTFLGTCGRETALGRHETRSEKPILSNGISI